MRRSTQPVSGEVVDRSSMHLLLRNLSADEDVDVATERVLVFALTAASSRGAKFASSGRT